MLSIRKDLDIYDKVNEAHPYYGKGHVNKARNFQGIMIDNLEELRKVEDIEDDVLRKVRDWIGDFESYSLADLFMKHADRGIETYHKRVKKGYKVPEYMLDDEIRKKKAAIILKKVYDMTAEKYHLSGLPKEDLGE